MDKAPTAPWPKIPDLSLRLDIVHELRRMVRGGAKAEQLQQLDCSSSYLEEAFHLSLKDGRNLYYGHESVLSSAPDSVVWRQPWLDTAEQTLRDAMYEELGRVAGQAAVERIVRGYPLSRQTRYYDNAADAIYSRPNGQSWTLHFRKTETYWELIGGVVSSPQTVTIREAVLNDRRAVLRLYDQLHDEVRGSEDDIAETWQQICENPALHCFVAEGRMRMLLGTCTLIVVPNLTRGVRPYGLIENVVTDADNRQQGIGTALMRHALAFAWERRCYKVMLLTSRTDEAVLRFYEHVGFVRGVKTGFVAKPPDV